MQPDKAMVPATERVRGLRSRQSTTMTAPQLIQNYLKLFEMIVTQSGLEQAIRYGEQNFASELPKVRHAFEKKAETIRSLSTGRVLRKKGVEQWYGGPSETDRHWPRLRKYLVDNKGWSEAAVGSIDAESTRVMSQLPHPGGRAESKGLVVGYVQSGKTANYTALIAKASDVGYRLVIVLAGIHNGLRRQTQKRLKEELIDTDAVLRETWHTLTYADADFEARGTNTDAFLGRESNQRILLVVKKNVHVLRRLVEWLNKGSRVLRENCPALIIDDEADQAGINTGKSETQRSTTNRRILELINALPKHAYVGYTATPFANVLVDPSGEDLYPEDFIVVLEKPKGYFGAELFSGREPLEDEEDAPNPPPDLFRRVAPEELECLRPLNSRKKDQRADFFPSIPPSLAHAIRYFVMATAARWVRGARLKHSSMLIHTSLYVDMHKKLLGAVEGELSEVRKEVTNPGRLESWRAHWEEEMSKVEPHAKGTVSFDQLAEHLPGVLSHLDAVMDNGESETRLLYDDEDQLNEDSKVVHIAVGGNTLSRGLTLEGLSVSYFLRGASAYDTLLQMGRWFGYRFGYEDLPRLWMTQELQDSFHDLATVEEEIRQEIRRYSTEFVTPREFGVRIREYPGLTVTSKLKMRHAKRAKVNYGGFTRQTTFFEHRDEPLLKANWNAGGQLLDGLTALLGPPKEDGSHTYFTNVPADRVLPFLDKYQFHTDHVELQPRLLKNYIESQNKKGRCEAWTVAVVSRQKEEVGTARLGSTLREFYLVNRAKRVGRGAGADLGTITTQKNFGFDIPDVPRDPELKRQPRRPLGTPPLLLLYPISKDSEPKRKVRGKPREPLKAAHDILGLAIAFPETPTGSDHDYVVVDLPEPEDYIEEEEAFSDEDDG